MHPIIAAVRKFSSWLAHRAAGRKLVVLGRDGWLIWATLRAMGVPVQYFHWSRNTDPLIAGRIWRNEVPPGSVVVDTGFSGSIIFSAQLQDQTISGAYLMSSNGHFQQPDSWLWEYPYDGCSQPLCPSAIRGLVLELEDFPKFHGPCTHYQEDRAVFWWDDRGEDGANPEASYLNARLALSELGIDGDPRFTGERGFQRLGLASHGEYREHCLEVRRQRRDLEREHPYPDLLTEPNACHMEFLQWLKGHPEELHDHIRSYPSMWSALHFRAGIDQSHRLVSDLVRDLPIA